MASERMPRTDLPAYFKAISERLELQVASMTPVIVHSGEMGANDQVWFADLLRPFLPQKYGLDSGFVVNQDSDKGSASFFAAGNQPRHQDPYISPQMDILVLDVLHNAPFCSEKTFKVCPVEMVLGAIEVTRFLDAEKLQQDCTKLSRIKELAKRRAYSQGHGYPHADLPFTCVVGLSSSLSFEAIREIHDGFEHSLRTDMIFLLDKAIYWFRKEGNNLIVIEKDRLYHFIALLRWALAMLPVDSADLQAYLPFDFDGYTSDQGQARDTASVDTSGEV